MNQTLEATRQWLSFAFGFNDNWVILYYLLVLGGIPLSWFTSHYAVGYVLTGLFFGIMIGRATAIDSEG